MVDGAQHKGVPLRQSRLHFCGCIPNLSGISKIECSEGFLKLPSPEHDDALNLIPKCNCDDVLP